MVRILVNRHEALTRIARSVLPVAGLAIDDTVWNHSVFSKNHDRLSVSAARLARQRVGDHVVAVLGRQACTAGRDHHVVATAVRRDVGHRRALAAHWHACLPQLLACRHVETRAGRNPGCRRKTPGPMPCPTEMGHVVESEPERNTADASTRLGRVFANRVASLQAAALNMAGDGGDLLLEHARAVLAVRHRARRPHPTEGG